MSNALAYVDDDLGFNVTRAIQFQAARAGFDLQTVPLDAERLWRDWLQGEDLRAALVVWREPPGGSAAGRFGMSAARAGGDVPVVPLYVVAVSIVARAGTSGTCASAAADGPLWNAHEWALSEAAGEACPTAA